jgi:hypothetical protein
VRAGQPLGAQHDRVETGIVEEICSDEPAPTSVLANAGADRRGRLSIDIGYHDDRAVPGQVFRDHSTGAGPGAGDNRYTVSNAHDNDVRHQARQSPFAAPQAAHDKCAFIGRSAPRAASGHVTLHSARLAA